MFPLQIQSSNIDPGQYLTELAHSSTDVESLFSLNTRDVRATLENEGFSPFLRIC
jgi:hypothetical protein